MFTPRQVKPATHYDVAAAAGVSRATVSFVLNGKENSRVSEQTKQRVINAAHALNYLPNATARHLAGGGATSGLLVPAAVHDFGASFMRALELFVTAEAANGSDVVRTADVTLSGRAAALAWSRFRPDAVVAEAQRCDDVATETLRQAGVHALVVYGPDAVDYAPALRISAEPFGFSAARYLAELGHRHLSYLDTSATRHPENEDKRLKGIRSALIGTSCSLSLVAAGESSVSLRDWAHSWRFSPGAATAVIAPSDRHAIAAIRALQNAGIRVPEEVSVLGADDWPTTEDHWPAVSTVSFPARRLADNLQETLALLRDGVPVSLVDLPAIDVIPRESTRMLPA